MDALGWGNVVLNRTVRVSAAETTLELMFPDSRFCILTIFFLVS